MAELLIVVVIAGVVLLYAADRARKLRARARQMSAMNERLDVAAAKVDEQQERKQARVRASAELTSVMPAIRRPPLTLPGLAGSSDEPDGEAGPEATPVAEAGPEAEDSPVAGQRPAAEAAPHAAAPHAEDSPGAEGRPAVAGPVPPEAPRTPEGTLTMPGAVIPDAAPAPMIRVTSDGTLTMPAVPSQGSGPAGGAAPARPRTQDAVVQERADRG